MNRSTEPELFLLRDTWGMYDSSVSDPILYAPLKHLAARVNEAAVSAVSRKLQGLPANPGDEAVLGPLNAHGFFDQTSLPEQQRSKPNHVTLFPTDGCNLRCRYCYANAAGTKHVMAEEVGKAAIDLVAGNAKELQTDCFIVGFHGNGEPFVAFSLVQKLCRYAAGVAEQVGIPVRFVAATNGVLSNEQLEWLLQWFDSVNVSFDGTRALQNYQRPMADGSESFPLVDRTLRKLQEQKRSFGIRTTLTADSLHCMTDIACFVADNYPGVDQLHIEPAWEAGRSLASGEHTPDAKKFVQEFIKAREAVKGRIRLVYSAARENTVALSFCAAATDGFTVTSEGLVTACYEACTLSDPRSERFIYGHYDSDKHAFVFDRERMEKLHALTVDHMPACRDCFCKYSCCGDCPAKLLGTKPVEEHAGSPRCLITRALTYRLIVESLQEENMPLTFGQESPEQVKEQE